MTRITALALALFLAACTGGAPAGPPKSAAIAAAIQVPDRLSDCVNYALIDDACTSNWYRCRTNPNDGESCRAAWKACCRLPGQGSRSRIGAPEPVDD